MQEVNEKKYKKYYYQYNYDNTVLFLLWRKQEGINEWYRKEGANVLSGMIIKYEEGK